MCVHTFEGRTGWWPSFTRVYYVYSVHASYRQPRNRTCAENFSSFCFCSPVRGYLRWVFTGCCGGNDLSRIFVTLGNWFAGKGNFVQRDESGVSSRVLANFSNSLRSIRKNSHGEYKSPRDLHERQSSAHNENIYNMR